MQFISFPESPRLIFSDVLRISSLHRKSTLRKSTLKSTAIVFRKLGSNMIFPRRPRNFYYFREKFSYTNVVTEKVSWSFTTNFRMLDFWFFFVFVGCFLPPPYFSFSLNFKFRQRKTQSVPTIVAKNVIVLKNEAFSSFLNINTFCGTDSLTDGLAEIFFTAGMNVFFQWKFNHWDLNDFHFVHVPIKHFDNCWSWKNLEGTWTFENMTLFPIWYWISFFCVEVWNWVKMMKMEEAKKSDKNKEISETKLSWSSS